MKHFLYGLMITLMTVTVSYGQLFINEIDYDQPSTDTAEFIEIAGPAGTYTNVRLELINGNTVPGTMYQSVDIPSLTLSNDKDGYGFFVIGAATVTNVDLTPAGWPTTNIIQNGAPDGVVLKINGVIVDAVSYEGSMNDENGNPMELASTADVWEGDEGMSLGRMGLKGSPWQVAAITPGDANIDQVFEDVNYPPVARAGNDRTVRAGDDVTLDGSESSDPDGSIESYLWTQIGGTAVSISNANTAVAGFVAPSSAANLVFRLEVTDDEGATGLDTVAITVVEVTESAIIISEYVEGSSNNKYLEIANVGDEAVDLNASGYTIGQAVNGSGNYSDLSFTDWGHLKNLGPGEVIVLAADGHSVYSSPDTVLIYPSVIHFNGNDAVALLQNGIVVDAVGDPNNSSYLIQDMTLRRKSNIVLGNPVFDLDEWTQLPIDDISGLGMHGGADAPAFDNPVRSPQFVTSANEIEVSIDIIPSENGAAITGMEIEFGTGGSFLNKVSKDDTWSDGNTWTGAIPAQSGNQKINYRFVAHDADEKSYTSGAFNVLVASTTPTPISEIHDNISAYDGQIKTIRGVMTIGVNIIQTGRTNAYVQDNSGNGLNLYDPVAYPDLVRGVEVTAVGEVDLYYTTIELKDFDYKIEAAGQELPAPAEITVAQANSDEWEGTLIKVTGTVSAITPYSNSTAVTIQDGGSGLEVVFWNSTGIDIAALDVEKMATFIGVGNQYASKYQLVVGYQDDFSVVTGLHDNISVIPENFELLPVYPNPFNARAVISWKLPESAQVTVDVVNLTGRVVAVLSQGYNEAGVYSHIWDAENLASGIYVVRMQTQNKRFHQKLVLLK